MFGKVNFMVKIKKQKISNVHVFTFLEAGIVFVESCEQVSGTLTNVVAAAQTMNVIDHIWPM